MAEVNKRNTGLSLYYNMNKNSIKAYLLRHIFFQYLVLFAIPQELPFFSSSGTNHRDKYIFTINEKRKW